MSSLLHSTSRIERVVESHIIQVKETATPDDDEDKDNLFPHDIFKVFAAEKKKHCWDKAKAPELSAQLPLCRLQLPPATTPAADNSRLDAQYHYRSNAEDRQLVSELKEYLLQGKLALTAPAHIFAASPSIRKSFAEKLKLQCVETHEYEVVPAADSQTQAARASRVTTRAGRR